jgi:hypothetical protein
MTDLTEQILPLILEHRLPGITLAEGQIHPYYSGLSLLNLPASVCRWLGVPDLAAGPLRPEILGEIGDRPARRVILVLVDGLGLRQFQRWQNDHPERAWAQLTRRGVFAPLTSIAPSTTSAALTTLWSGRSPAEHGIVGYELWLKEYGLVANMIRQSPMSFDSNPGSAGSLSLAGFEPETVLPWPTLGTHLAGYGIKSYAFQHSSIARSGLSRMFFRDVNIRPFISASDLWTNLRYQLESSDEERFFAWAYWSEVDLLGHMYGPEDERYLTEFSLFSRSFEDFFLHLLSDQARKDTLLIFLADHGQLHTPLNPHYDLKNHPGLTRRLHILPTGENRLSYLYPRPGQVEAVNEYIQRTWPRQFHLLNSGYAVEAGLFGPGEAHPALADRVGDTIAAARQQAYLWWSPRENPLLGRHGGFSPEEMLVPFIASWL